MVFGVFLIVAGVLIALYPQLLSLIVASVLIFAGAIAVSLGYSYRKLSKHPEDPVTRFFIRF